MQIILLVSDDLLVRRIAAQAQLLGVEDSIKQVQKSLRFFASKYEKIADELPPVEGRNYAQAILRTIATNEKELAAELNAAKTHLADAHAILRTIAPNESVTSPADSSS